jgi:tetratricopeptide (TPR) repeat protein
MKRLILALSVSLPLLHGCNALRGASEEELPSAREVAELVAEGALEVPPIGAYGRQVSGASAEAQAWFDQGIRYTYGFNQDQAAACYARAALASPECAMAWWGMSHIYSGVDINNNVVAPDEAKWGMVAMREAERLAPMATALEQELIAAASQRAVLPMPAPTERAHLDDAYREAMKEVWDRHPDDVDVGTLYAEAMMNCQPWEYWTSDYEPVKRTEEIVAQLERCIELGSRHPGAHHLYIHIVESSGKAERGIPSADLLGELMPGSGHLIHMPSHIYVNVGRYNDAIRVNRRAVELDGAYMAAYGRPTIYLNYFAHNIQFTAFGAMMEGRKAMAIEYVDRLETLITDPVIEMFAPFIDGLNALRLHVYVRFGMWEEVLAYPEYAEFRKASRTLRRYARTVALANLGRTDEARLELARFDLAASETPEEWFIAFNPCQTVFGLARRVAEAEIYWREGDAARAIGIMKDTLATEHELIYTEPPPWMIPIRHALGAIQLASGDALGAEVSYRENLKKHPENAWSLLGLQQSLTKLGKLEEASALDPRVKRAWARADIDPPASCYCGVALK